MVPMPSKRKGLLSLSNEVSGEVAFAPRRKLSSVQGNRSIIDNYKLDSTIRDENLTAKRQYLETRHKSLPMSTNPLNISSILYEVRNRRSSENVANCFKFIGICCLALLAANIIMFFAIPPDQMLEFTSVTLGILFFGTINLAFNFLFLFWPFLLYFLANVQVVRQRTLLSLFQTAVETGKPLQDIVRAYAASCSWNHAVRLNRFAAALDSGLTLEAAVHENRGLFRYDVAGMIRLGGDAPETLRSLEDVAQDERNFTAILTNTLIRIVYLCTIVLWMFWVMTFFLIKIIPEFRKVFQEFDSQLPDLTNVVVGISDWFVNYWFLISPLVMVFAALAIIFMVLQTNVVIFRPIGFRRIFRSTDTAKFLRLFSVGVRHRFPIPTILEMYRWTVPSEYLRQKGWKVQNAIEKGRDWIDAVRREGFVNGPEASLLQSAQRTGNTAAVLEQLAQSKERSQIRKDDLFSKLVFIPLVFLLGAVIGTFVIAMFLPLIKLITDLSAS